MVCRRGAVPSRASQRCSAPQIGSGTPNPGGDASRLSNCIGVDRMAEQCCTEPPLTKTARPLRKLPGKAGFCDGQAVTADSVFIAAVIAVRNPEPGIPEVCRNLGSAHRLPAQFVDRLAFPVTHGIALNEACALSLLSLISLTIFLPVRCRCRP